MPHLLIILLYIFSALIASGNAVPYSEAVFRAGSASATPVITIDAGSDHREWKTRLDEKCNSASVPRLRCRRLSMTDDVTLRVQGYWPAGALDVTEVTDADGAVSLEFTDFRGRKLLSRRLLADGTQLDTYFVYDPWGNLVLVLPPMATPVSGNVTTSSSMKDYAYHYVYDKTNRMVSKKLPGAEKITYGYDADGLPAFTQDGNMRRDGKAMFTLYDAAGRVAVTGLCSSSAMDACATLRMRATFSPSALGVDSTHYVTSASLPGAEMLTATYYDAVPAFLGVQYTATGVLAKPMGLVTAQVDRVLGTAGRTRVQTVNFYDSHERLIYTSSTTADGSTIKTDTEYDFAGNPVKVRRTTVAAGQTMTDTYAYGYDRLNRPTTVTLSHNGGDALTLVSNTYDALGRLRSNGAPGKAKTYYDYDLRGALNKLTSNHFTQSLYRGTGKYSSRSGRITRNDLNVTGRRLISDYLYDHAGRLTRAEAKLENTGVDYTQEMEYDLNANVTAMRRYGAINAREGALLDDLTIEYQGNRMEFVTDDAEAYPYEASLDFRARAPIASTPGASVAAPFSLLGLTPDKPIEPHPLNPYNYAADFDYDANGNMTQDRHSAITAITYNVLNLPTQVLYEGLANNRPVSEMVYDASGRKHIVRNGVKKLGAFTGDVTRYVGDYIIVNDTVDRLQTPYGYLRDGEFHSYVFDYQGNVMVVVSGDKVDQTNLYYADGLPMNVSTDATANRFKYSAKELSLFRGLPVYDYTARHTLPQLSNTFRTMDPCAESFYSISPYSYCGGDPINCIDPTGQEIKCLEMIGDEIKEWTCKQVDGSWGLYDSMGNAISGDEFAGKVNAAIEKLVSGNVGNFIVSALAESETLIRIVDPNNPPPGLSPINETTEYQSSSKPNSNRIFWDSTEDNWSESTPGYIGLAHELGHAYDDIILGGMDGESWNGTDASKAEVFSGNVENQVRAEHGLPARVSYFPGLSKSTSATIYPPARVMTPTKLTKQTIKSWKNTVPGSF